jgi:hypothetical protein
MELRLLNPGVTFGEQVSMHISLFMHFLPDFAKIAYLLFYFTYSVLFF